MEGLSQSGPDLGLLGPAELELRRTDGFRNLVAPHLRGEGNWPGAALDATPATRIFHAIDALLSAVPFWFKVAIAMPHHIPFAMAHLSTRLSVKSPRMLTETELEFSSMTDAVGSCHCSSEIIRTSSLARIYGG